MAKYIVHSDNGNGEITIRPIENGFIITYKYLTGTKEEYVGDVAELNEWLFDFYKKEK